MAAEEAWEAFQGGEKGNRGEGDCVQKADGAQF